MLQCIKVQDHYYLTDHTNAARLRERLEAGEAPDTPCNRVRSYEAHVAEIDGIIMDNGYSKGDGAHEHSKKLGYIIQDLQYKLTRARQLEAICAGEAGGYEQA